MRTELASLIARAVPSLSAVSDAEAARKPSPDKWSRKEILGHLIDSAANNHQRFVRLQLEPELHLPGYEQDGWVRVNRYQQSMWVELIALWGGYNRHLASVIESLEEGVLQHVWHSPAGPVTLEYLAHDYVVHMRHHLRQIGIEV